MILTESVVVKLWLDIGENYDLCWKHGFGGTKDSIPPRGGGGGRNPSSSQQNRRQFFHKWQ
jgi:hypothetical protein